MRATVWWKSRGNPDRIYPVNDYLMILDPTKKGIHTDLIYRGIREPYATKFLQENVRSDDIVIEVGANIGYFAILESKRAVNGKIFAIEPVPNTRSALKSNLDLNKCDNIEIYPFAIGDNQGKGIMYVPERCNWASLTPPKNGEVTETVEVDVTTIDDFVSEYVHGYPNLIRMDIEGLEYQAVLGSLDTLQNSSRLRLFIEIHPWLLTKEQKAELISIFKSYGFIVEAIFREPTPDVMNHLETINWLNKKAHISKHGPIGNGYVILEDLLRRGEGCHVFFLKDASVK